MTTYLIICGLATNLYALYHLYHFIMWRTAQKNRREQFDIDYDSRS